MAEAIPVHSELLDELKHWWRQNQAGDWSCKWRRRSVWGQQVLQKLGVCREVTAPLFFGDRMRIVTNETVSRGILAFGYCEAALTALMLHVVEPGQMVVDIGTHFGYEAMLACRLVGPMGKVVCFEPNAESMALARKNLGAFPQVELRLEAVADRSGTLRLRTRPVRESAFVRAYDENDSGPAVEVPVATLDEVLVAGRRVDFLKCDAEGMELSILRGAHRLLSEDGPVLVLESDMPSAEGRVAPRANELAAYLQSYGYLPFSFEFDGSFRCGPLDSLPVFHANVAFVPAAHTDVLRRLGQL